MQTRLIRVVATSLSEGLTWKGPCSDGSTWHSARWAVARVAGDVNEGLPRVDLDAVAARHPDAKCERCSAPASGGVELSGFSGTNRVYDTPSGDPEPGSLFWAPWQHGDGKCWRWDNCADPRGHLHCILPDGHPWDIDGRASNCTMPEDKTHRCWVRHGDPDKGEAVHVDKAGITCAAGAGSIATTGYHGFLVNGVLRQC